MADLVIEGIKYALNDDLTATVIGLDNSSFTGTVTIPETIKYYGNTYQITQIGERAFNGCSGLTSVTIPNSVTSIGRGAFFDCSGLTSVTIPNSVTSIGRFAFYMCSGLTSVTIPNSVTSIGNDAFLDCSGLTEINVDENNTVYSSIDGVVFNKSQTELVCYPCGKQGAYIIPNSVTSIGSSAFSGCTGLTSVNIPNSVTSIGEYAFHLCGGLTSITIPDFVESIGNNAFLYCHGLTIITIGNSVTSIGFAAFSGCSGLTSVTIPNSVTSIGRFAFDGCTGLTSVTIPNSVTSIGISAFDGCSGLTEINVDENNSTYSSIDGVVFNKSQTELVLCPRGKQGTYTIPNSVTGIGSYAFFDCSGLTSVTIPNSVTSIGRFAFEGCSGLTDIYCHIEEPLAITIYVFTEVTTSTCTLHVPIGSKEKYEVAEMWEDFLNIVEDLPTGIVSIDNSQSTIDNDVWFTLNGVRLNGKPTIPGIYIVNGLKVVIK